MDDLKHYVNGNPLFGPFPAGMRQVLFALGCFWGAERLFWQVPGVWVTSVGYTGGHLDAPDYRAVCTGTTGHAEAVQVVYDPARVTFGALLQRFWEGHNPTQGMRQGNDRGSQYRSGIYVFSEADLAAAQQSMQAYQAALAAAGHPAITTEIAMAGPYYPAEEYHQQYLAKNPDGYCGLGGTGVTCALD